MVRWSVGDTRDAQQLDEDTRLRRESVRLDAGCCVTIGLGCRMRGGRDRGPQGELGGRGKQRKC